MPDVQLGVVPVEHAQVHVVPDRLRGRGRPVEALKGALLYTVSTIGVRVYCIVITVLDFYGIANLQDRFSFCGLLVVGQGPKVDLKACQVIRG